MTAPTPAVSIYLPTTTAVTTETVNVTISRGRTSPLFDDFTAGTASITLNNEDRAYDPLNAAGAYYGEIVPGRRAVVTATPSGGSAVTLFDGRVADWSFEYDRNGRSLAMAELEDGLAKLARASFDEWTTTYGEYPGARISTAVARTEVDYSGTVTVDTGLTPLVDDFVSWGSNVLNYLQLVARTDLGYLFVTRAGVLRFLDRHAFINATPAVTFTDDGTGPSFSQLTTTYGAEELFNRVSIDRTPSFVLSEVDGFVDPDPVAVTDATSITAYDGVFSLDYSDLLMQDATTAEDMADYLLSVYKDPLYRFSSITVLIHKLSAADQALVLALDIGSVVSVEWTPNGVGSAITRTCIVEGITHVTQPKVHEMTLTLGDAAVAQTGNYWTVGDATYGVINGGTGVFNYPVAF